MLSDEQIYECERIASIRHRKHTNSIRGQQITSADDPQWHFARAIEAEVRKQDDELILQLVEALESARVWKCKEIHHIMREVQYTPAIQAGRARLREKT